LEGRLIGPWVEELRRYWRQVLASSGSGFVVDLTGITFIDGTAKALLTEMKREGAELVASGCCNKSIVEDIGHSAEATPAKQSGLEKNS
jgi:hypothetical protein